MNLFDDDAPDLYEDDPAFYDDEQELEDLEDDEADDEADDDEPQATKSSAQREYFAQRRAQQYAKLISELPNASPAPPTDRQVQQLRRAIYRYADADTDKARDVPYYKLYYAGFSAGLADAPAAPVLRAVEDLAEPIIDGLRLRDAAYYPPQPTAAAIADELLNTFTANALSEHELYYKFHTYGQAQREAMLAELRARGILDAKGRIIRPADAGIQQHTLAPAKQKVNPLPDAEVYSFRRSPGRYSYRTSGARCYSGNTPGRYPTPAAAIRAGACELRDRLIRAIATATPEEAPPLRRQLDWLMREFPNLPPMHRAYIEANARRERRIFELKRARWKTEQQAAAESAQREAEMPPAEPQMTLF